MLDHLMTESSSFGKARREARCGASGKRRNAADGLLSVTRWVGLFRPLSASARACGGATPRRAILLVSKRNCSDQMTRHLMDVL
jgi:hypothetical protein